MRVFADSSALAKRYIAEPGGPRLQSALEDASALGVSMLCIPEIVSALNRRRRERTLTRAGYGAAKRALLDDVHDAEVVELTADVVRITIDLLERHPLRAMDALHVGSAIAWHAERFLSSDRRQIRAATAGGLRAIEV